MEYEIVIPQQQSGRETFILRHADGREEAIDYYNYGRVYALPGLAKQLRRSYFHSYSDWILCDAFLKVVKKAGVAPGDIRILDLGAGSGCFGAEAKRQGFGCVVGVDIVPEAKAEAERQYPGAHDVYYVLDIQDGEAAAKIAPWKPNALVAINALGDEHVSREIFQSALSYISQPGWVVFNVMADDNETISAEERIWFCESFDVVDCFKFFHRTSIDGHRRYFNNGYICRVSRRAPGV